MRPEENALDLNNLPHEYSRDHHGKQVLQHSSSSSGSRKKKSKGKEEKEEECGKVYECRFCSLKFCKSQALGGHMNRHRQERETETLNHARQLVYRNDHHLTTQQQAPSHLRCCPPPITSGGSYHPARSNMGDPKKSVRFPRYLSTIAGSTSRMPPPAPPQQHFSHYGISSTSYTIGAPVGVVGQAALVGSNSGRDRSLLQNQHQQEEQGLNWVRSYPAMQQQHHHHYLNPLSPIHRSHDNGFL